MGGENPETSSTTAKSPFPKRPDSDILKKQHIIKIGDKDRAFVIRILRPIVKMQSLRLETRIEHHALDQLVAHYGKTLREEALEMEGEAVPRA